LGMFIALTQEGNEETDEVAAETYGLDQLGGKQAAHAMGLKLAEELRAELPAERWQGFFGRINELHK